MPARSNPAYSKTLLKDRIDAALAAYEEAGGTVNRFPTPSPTLPQAAPPRTRPGARRDKKPSPSEASSG